MNKKIIAIDRAHLELLIKEEIQLNGNECSLNHIDVSKINYLSYLFFDSPFNGNISEWNTSNAINMEGIFKNSSFNGDISNWDTSNVKDMSYAFSASPFNQDISKWNVENVYDMEYMFYNSKFNQDLTNWKPFSLKNKKHAFRICKSKKPYWYLAKNTEEAVNHYLKMKAFENLDSYITHKDKIIRKLKL